MSSRADGDVARNPLIGDDDVFLFVHIPKAAGLSVISVLDLQFDTEEIFPLHSLPSPDSLSIYHSSQLKKVRLVRGHFRFGPGDRGLYAHIAQNPILMTVLRDPVDRVVSAYKYCRSTLIVQVQPKQVTVRKASLEEATRTWDQRRRQLYSAASAVSLREFARDPYFHDQVYNRQAFFVLGISRGFPRSPGDPAALSETALTHMAIQRLEQFAFVGIVEHLGESLTAMASMFGWSLPDRVPHLNESEATRADIPLDTRRDIEERNRIDFALYERAKAILDAELRNSRARKSTSVSHSRHDQGDRPADGASGIQEGEARLP
jgi:hypothetical protein